MTKEDQQTTIFIFGTTLPSEKLSTKSSTLFFSKFVVETIGCLLSMIARIPISQIDDFSVFSIFVSLEEELIVSTFEKETSDSSQPFC